MSLTRSPRTTTSIICALVIAMALLAQAAGIAHAQSSTGDSTPQTSGQSDPTASSTPESLGDMFENNYSLETAARLAWGVPYDLTLRCPDRWPGACVSGDHDFFRVAIKRGVPFVAATYDLGPGADTTLALYVPAPGQIDPATRLAGWRLLIGNDDAVHGRTLRSQVLVMPDWDGEALLIVAASDRADPPLLPPVTGLSGSYRLIVGSPFLPAIQAALGAQPGSADHTTDKAAPPITAASSTPAATVLATPMMPSGDAEEIIRETCLTGTARVVSVAGARFSAAAAPARETRYLMVYPQDTQVELLGSCYLGWVKVRPFTAVSPGWMFAPDLELVEVAAGPAESSTPGTGAPGPGQETTPRESATSEEIAPTPGPLTIVPLPTPAGASPLVTSRQLCSVTVQITDGQQRPRAGVRVQLVDVFGAVLREGPTDDAGRITLVADLPPSAAVWVQLPAIGLTTPVDRAAPELSISVSGL